MTTTPQPEWEDHLADAPPTSTGTLHGNTASPTTRTTYVAEPRLTPVPTPVTPWEQAPRLSSGMAPSPSHEYPPMLDAPPAATPRSPTFPMNPAAADHPYVTTQDTGPLRASAAAAAAAWGSWDENPPPDYIDYEMHESNVFFRARATCKYCRKDIWSEFGYGASPYFDLVSKGLKKGKQGWRRACCPECAQTW